MNAILSNILLGCFLFGTLFTLLSLVLGFDAHGGGHGHVGHGGGGGHAGHVGGHGHAPVPHTAADFAGTLRGVGRAAHHGLRAGLAPRKVPFLNFNSLLMFVTCFGGVGYALLHDGGPGYIPVALGAATVAGLVGSSAVVLFMNKVLLRAETVMDPADYYMPGTLARVTSGIRADGGTGEVVYAQAGARKTLGARADDGATPFTQGEEVIVVRCDRGLAYVRPVDDLGLALESPP